MKAPIAHALVLFSLCCSPALSQTITAVVDAASSTADVSPGALATIYGSNLSYYTASSSNYPTSLDGVSVTINGVAAPLLYVTGSQINIQIPYEVQPGSAIATVYSSGAQSNDFSFDVYSAAPGIFASADEDSITQNADGSLNARDNPAAPGSVVVVYLTGIGPLDNPLYTGEISPGSPLSRAALSYSASVGGQPAAIDFLGLTPGFLGLAQCNLVIPNLADGDYPLTISIGNNASNSPYLAVAANGVRGYKVPRKINARIRK
jgi:uncharacterized protein (TIGR03437 family)